MKTFYSASERGNKTTKKSRKEREDEGGRTRVRPRKASKGKGSAYFFYPV